MFALTNVRYDGDPPLSVPHLELPPGALPAVVGPDDSERTALVELLAGYRTEAQGALALDGTPLSPRARRTAVVVLPNQAALTENLSIAEHLRLVARLRSFRADNAVLENVLAFARLEDPALRPGALSPEGQYRLTIALAVVGRPALAVALDPPPALAAMMLELKRPDRALVLVTASLQGIDDHVTEVHRLQQGEVTAGLAAPVESAERTFVLQVIRGSPALESQIGRQPGASLQRLSEGIYRLHVAPAVPLAALLRRVVRAGVLLEAIRPA